MQENVAETLQLLRNRFVKTGLLTSDDPCAFGVVSMNWIQSADHGAHPQRTQYSTIATLLIVPEDGLLCVYASRSLLQRQRLCRWPSFENTSSVFLLDLSGWQRCWA